MRILLGIGTICLGAGLVMPAAFGQQAAPRARAAVGVQPAETPYLGVGGQDVTSDRAKTLKLKEEIGVEVTSVEPDSAAAKAGLKEGDVVMEYNGQKVEGWEHLKRLVRETPVHREVKLSVWRNGAMQTLTATVGSHREFQVELGDGSMMFPNIRVQPMTPGTPMPDMPSIDIPQMHTIMSTSMLGITTESLGQDSQLAEFFGVKQGALVRAVTKGSAAEKAGMKAGDVITKIEDTTIAGPQQINSALRAARTKTTVVVTVMRNKKEMTLSVSPEAGGMYRGGLFAPDNFNGGNWFVMQGDGQGLDLKQLFQPKASKIFWQ